MWYAQYRKDNKDVTAVGFFGNPQQFVSVSHDVSPGYQGDPPFDTKKSDGSCSYTYNLQTNQIQKKS